MPGLLPSQIADITRASVLRMANQHDANPAVRKRAAMALTVRLAHWHGDFLPPQGRFKDKRPLSEESPALVRADPIELLIVRAIAMTSIPGAAQFGVSTDRSVFTTDALGWSLHSGRRYDVTGLSPLLDEAADIFNFRRGGIGGRFYERDGSFFMADGKTTFLEVLDVGPDGAKGWWQRITSSVLMLLRDGDPQPDVPQWVLPTRRSFARFDHNQPPEYCKVHHIELPATGQCDECC
jgi:hypothetical protein